MLADRETAEQIELFREYTPEPPFTAGSPDTAPKAVVEKTRTKIAPMLERRKAVSQSAAKKMKAKPSAA